MEVHETQKEFKNDIFFLLKYDLEPKPVHNRYTYLIYNCKNIDVYQNMRLANSILLTFFTSAYKDSHNMNGF